MMTRPRGWFAIDADAISLFYLLEMLIVNNRLISHYAKYQQCAEQRKKPNQGDLRDLLARPKKHTS